MSNEKTDASWEETRKQKLKAQQKARRLRSVLLAIFILFTVVNVGFGVLNLQTLLRKNREPVPAETGGSDEENVPDDTRGAQPEEPEQTPEAQTDEPVETPAETDTEAPESVPEEAQSSESEAAESEAPESEASESGSEDETSAFENDPRYSVTKKYENIGVIHNVNNFLNIRKSPDPNAMSIGKAMRKSAVTVLEEEENGWLKIRSGEHEGYVSGEYVATGEEGVVLAMEYCKNNAFSKSQGLEVYRSANTGEEVIFRINPENGYPVLDVIGSWVKIQITDGLSGYVERDLVDVRYTLEEPIFFVTDEDVSELRLAIVNRAFEYYGGKYVWGGTDLSTGVDCSGYTLRIYEAFGINLPRLSSEQARWGKAVNSMEEALPGDLLFFHGYRNGTVTEGVGHVAIYIGNGKMIHAASEARGIVADNYNYVGKPIGIRRVITEQAEKKYQENH